MGIVSRKTFQSAKFHAPLIRSTRNTRIERLWVEVGSQFARRWRVFFATLESRYYLDTTNPHHLWLLGELFLDDINKDCQDFAATYNYHPVKSTGTGHMSPEVSTSMFDIFSPLAYKLHARIYTSLVV